MNQNVPRSLNPTTQELERFRKFLKKCGASSKLIEGEWPYNTLWDAKLGHRHGVSSQKELTPEEEFAAFLRSMEFQLPLIQSKAPALDRLGSDQKKAVLLVDGCGATYVQAAQFLNIEKIGTLKSRLSRARAQLAA